MKTSLILLFIALIVLIQVRKINFLVFSKRFYFQFFFFKFFKKSIDVKSLKAVRKCNKGSDCQADECCVYSIQPLGRHRRQLVVPTLAGVCSKKPAVNDDCVALLNPDVDFDNEIVQACPCAGKSTCIRKPNAVFTPPAGYTGTCIV